jgi:hypothetical protein
MKTMMNAKYLLTTALIIVTMASCNRNVGDLPFICNQQIKLDLPQTKRFLGLRFVEDDKMLARAWIQDVDHPGSLKVQSWQVNLATRQFSEVAQSPIALMNDPCNGQCNTTVIDESPNKQWQIALAKGQLRQSGLWLVGNQQQIKLTDSGYDAKWAWSTDSTAVWFSQPARYGFGLLGRLLYLRQVVRAHDFPQELISANDSRVVFLPDEKVIASIDPARTGLDSSETITRNQTLSKLTIISDVVTISKTGSVEGLAKISWDAGRQSLLMTLLSNADLNIALPSGIVLARVPRSVFESNHFEARKLLFDSNAELEEIILSTDRRHLAWIDGSAIVVYQCAKA